MGADGPAQPSLPTSALSRLIRPGRSEPGPPGASSSRGRTQPLRAWLSDATPLEPQHPGLVWSWWRSGGQSHTDGVAMRPNLPAHAGARSGAARPQDTVTEPWSQRRLRSLSAGGHLTASFSLAAVERKPCHRYRNGPCLTESTLKAEASCHLSSDKETRHHAKCRVSLGSRGDGQMSACPPFWLEKFAEIKLSPKTEQPEELNSSASRFHAEKL